MKSSLSKAEKLFLRKRSYMEKQLSALVIIEDDERSSLFKEVLEEDKFRVIIASTSNEARLKFSNEVFQMVVFDMNVRGFKDSEFIEGIRRKERMKNVKDNIPILVTGDKAEEYSSKYASIDNIKYLEIPYTKIELKKKLLDFTGNKDAIFKNTKIIYKDEYLITEGGTSHEMYWVLSGKFMITKMNHEDQNVIIGEIQPGELVGEMSFLDNLPRSASVKALEDSEVLTIPYKKFVDTLDNQPRWFKSLMQTMSQRLRKANKKITRKLVDIEEAS